MNNMNTMNNNMGMGMGLNNPMGMNNVNMSANQAFTRYLFLCFNILLIHLFIISFNYYFFIQIFNYFHLINLMYSLILKYRKLSWYTLYYHFINISELFNLIYIKICSSKLIR